MGAKEDRKKIISRGKKIFYMIWFPFLIIGTWLLYISDPVTMHTLGMVFMCPVLMPAITTKDKKYWISAIVVMVVTFGIGYVVGSVSKEMPMYTVMGIIKNVFVFTVDIYYLFCCREIVAISMYTHSEEYKLAKSLKAKERRKKYIGDMRARNHVEGKEIVSGEKGMNQDAVKTVDVNACSEEGFLTLPGMSLSAARTAVELRETEGPYLSLDDFVMRNQIKPHFMLQMQSFVVIGEVTEMSMETETGEGIKRGRAIDL